jgi:glucose-1-phosphate thymidylyltransferase
LTYTQPKPLIPVAGKPIISYIIENLKKANVEEYIFVIGYLGEKIKDYIEAAYPDLKTVFVQQDQRIGTGHAIYSARKVIKNAEEVFIYYGDTLVDMDFGQMIGCPTSCFAVKKVEQPGGFGIVEFDYDGNVKRVVEKPKIPKSNMAMVGLYRIKEVGEMLDSIKKNIKKGLQSEGEFSLTDALMGMIEKDIQFSAIEVDSWYDCGKKETLLETNAIFLDRKGYASYDLPNYDNTIVIHPVSIGKDCVISDSIIGPHVTIGNQVTIGTSIIESSIIGNYAALSEVALKNSVIGNDTSIKGFRQSLNIGDNTEIDLS